MSKSKEEILVILEGGLVQDVIIPKNSNSRIIIRDYDIETVEERSLLYVDDDGDECIESIWEN